MMLLTVLRRALVITGRVTSALLAVLGLIVCAAAVTLWVRGYFVVDLVERIDRVVTAGGVATTTVRVSSGRGALAFNVIRSSDVHSGYLVRQDGRLLLNWMNRQYVRKRLTPDQFNLRTRTVWQKLGFNYTYADNSTLHPRMGPTQQWSARLPYWLIVAVAAALSWWFLGRLRLRRRYRARRGLCPGCGYDLRASTGRCPECGETIPERATPAALGVAA
jgi:hypothetical protein